MHKLAPTIILAAIFLALYQYAKIISYRDPGSIFFDKSRAYDKRYSDIRLEEIKDVKITRSNSDVEPTTCAVFTSWKRPIEITLQSALAGLYPQEREDIHVAVLFAHGDPNVHPSWGIDIDKTLSYGNDSRLIQLEESNDYMRKGVADYIFALEYCKSKGSPWIAVFEDDILFADSWYARLKQALEQRHSEELLYLRVFNYERATGWARVGFFANNELYIGLGIDAVVAAIARFSRRSLSTILPLLIFIPSVVTLFYASGKATMLPPQPGIREENFGCCSQALIYPQWQLQPLIDHLRHHDSGQVDILVNRFGYDRGYHRKSIYPMMVQHRGASAGSVRGTTSEDAQKIWSMAFESLDSRQLKKDHRELAGKIWPEILETT